MQQHGHELRKYLDRQAMTAFAEAPTQQTGAIKPIRLAKQTDKLPTLQQPDCPPVKVVHIGSVLLPLIKLTDISEERVLQGYRLAYLNQRLGFNNALYVIRQVFFEEHTGKVYARLEREDA